MVQRKKRLRKNLRESANTQPTQTSSNSKFSNTNTLEMTPVSSQNLNLNLNLNLTQLHTESNLIYKTQATQNTQNSEMQSNRSSIPDSMNNSDILSPNNIIQQKMDRRNTQKKTTGVIRIKRRNNVTDFDNFRQWTQNTIEFGGTEDVEYQISQQVQIEQKKKEELQKRKIQALQILKKFICFNIFIQLIYLFSIIAAGIYIIQQNHSSVANVLIGVIVSDDIFLVLQTLYVYQKIKVIKWCVQQQLETNQNYNLTLFTQNEMDQEALDSERQKQLEYELKLESLQEIKDIVFYTIEQYEGYGAIIRNMVIKHYVVKYFNYGILILSEIHYILRLFVWFMCFQKIYENGIKINEIFEYSNEKTQLFYFLMLQVMEPVFLFFQQIIYFLLYITENCKWRKREKVQPIVQVRVKPKVFQVANTGTEGVQVAV